MAALTITGIRAGLAALALCVVACAQGRVQAPSRMAAEDRFVVLGHPDRLAAAGADILSSDGKRNLAVAVATAGQLAEFETPARDARPAAGYLILRRLTGGADGAFDKVAADAALHMSQEASERNKRYREQFATAAVAAPPPDPETKAQVALAVADIRRNDGVESTVRMLASYGTRHYAAPRHDYIDWLTQKLESMAAAAGRQVELVPVAINGVAQPSLIARIRGSGVRQSEIIVIGAHLDSINSDPRERTPHPNLCCAPGADDNASGVAVVLEAYRVLLNAPARERTVEFHFYAKEEAGLEGSSGIASNYKSESRDVVAALNFDMALYPGSGDGDIFIDMNTIVSNHSLGDRLMMLDDRYPGILAARLQPAVCEPLSDHWSWGARGFATTWITEADCEFGGLFRERHTAADHADNPGFSYAHGTMIAELAAVAILDLSSGDWP